MKKQFLLFVLIVMIVLTSFVNISAVDAASESFEPAGLWTGVISGKWTESYSSARHSEVQTYPYSIEVTLEAQDSGNFTGRGVVRFGQPQYAYTGGGIERAVITATPTEFQVGVYGNFLKDGKIFLGIDGDTTRHIVYTYYYEGGHNSVTADLEMKTTERSFAYKQLDKAGDVLSVSFYAEGEEAVGNLYRQTEYLICTDVIGDAYMLRYGEETPIRKGIRVASGDTIITSRNSQVELAFLDGSVVKIDKNAECTVEELMGPPEEESVLKNVLKFSTGKIYFKLFPSEKPKEIHTSSFAMTVRGTEFTLEVADDGLTTLIVLEGIVEFSDLNRTKMVEVGQYEASVVKPGELPSDPTVIDADEIDRWWEPLSKEVIPKVTPTPEKPPEAALVSWLSTLLMVAIVVVIVVGVAYALRKKK